MKQNTRFRKMSAALALVLVLTLALPWTVLASSVDVAVVDITAPTGSVELAPGGSGTIKITASVTGKQDGTATFQVYKDWTLSGDTFTGSNPQTFTVPPRPIANAPATVFTINDGTITVTSDQGADTFTLAVSAFGITNSNTTGAKLADGADSNYQVIVSAPINTPPTLNLPADMTVEGNTVDGAYVAYLAATAIDAEDEPDPTPTCMPASESFFPLGTTTVNCTVTDSGGLTDTGSFNITVQDTTAPTLHDVPADMTVEGNTTGGANVTYTTPTASDIVDPNPLVSCVPTSGSFFALGGTHHVTCTAKDGSSNSAIGSFNVTVVDTTPPNITCPADFEGKVGDTVSLGSPTVTDIVDADPSVSNNAPVTFPPGTTTITWTATDASGNSVSCTQKVTLLYDWNGFFQPVDNDALNATKAGSAIPVKFSLGGYQGLGIFATGYPKSSQISCTTREPEDAIEETVTAGQSSLNYDDGQYIYVWKTVKSWAGYCRQLEVKLIDGTSHFANFKFK
jgi:hypothetical protein